MQHRCVTHLCRKSSGIFLFSTAISNGTPWGFNQFFVAVYINVSPSGLCLPLIMGFKKMNA